MAVKWPDFGDLMDEATCNLEGFVTAMEPYTYYNGMCVPFDELEAIFERQEELQKEEEQRKDQEAEEEIIENEGLRLECIARGDVWLTPAEVNESTFSDPNL